MGTLFTDYFLEGKPFHRGKCIYTAATMVIFMNTYLNQITRTAMQTAVSTSTTTDTATPATMTMLLDD